MKTKSQSPPDNLEKDSQRQISPACDKSEAKGKVAAKSMATAPVFYNRMNLADELKMSKSKIFRAYAAGVIDPDAFMCDGQPLFFACRVAEIAMLLKKL